MCRGLYYVEVEVEGLVAGEAQSAYIYQYAFCMCQRSFSCLHLAAVLGLLAREDESASRGAPDWTAVIAFAVVVATTQSVLSRRATATAGLSTAATWSARRAQWWSSSITVIKSQSDLACLHVCRCTRWHMHIV